MYKNELKTINIQMLMIC